MADRAKFAPLASGKVLEIGIGSGLNIPFCSPEVTALVGVDPSRELWKIGHQRAAAAPFPVEYLEVSGERLPLEDATFDTVVTTWTLCSIVDPLMALKETRRLLKPHGLCIFVAHGLAPDRRVRTWQYRLNPLWRRLAGGCNINRPIDTLIVDAGFHISQLETAYIKGPKVLSFFYNEVGATPLKGGSARALRSGGQASGGAVWRIAPTIGLLRPSVTLNKRDHRKLSSATNGPVLRPSRRPKKPSKRCICG
jgi:SAM-dependent methyltransferase